jgi:hypothetical protein
MWAVLSMIDGARGRLRDVGELRGEAAEATAGPRTRIPMMTRISR